jgi:hypothetical protein
MNAYLDMAHQRIAGSEWESRLELARIRLQLSPQVNHYDMAARMLSAMRPRPLSGSNRSLLDGYAMVLSASTGSQEETLGKLRGWLPGASSGERLEIARLLERRASAARSELDRRRLGEPLGRVVEDRGAFAMGGERAEAAILGVRSLQLTGRGREAVEEALDGLPSPGNRAEPETERARARIELELGRTDAGLGRLDRLAGAYREGSPGWWRARLELASGCLWAGRKGQAAEVLDAAAVLYPERGDAAIGEVWEALRARAGRGSPRREKKG